MAGGCEVVRHAGGMPPIPLAEPTGRYLAFEEREEIAIFRAMNKGVREIARALERDPGTISRELRRNAATRSGKQEYRDGRPVESTAGREAPEDCEARRQRQVA